MGNSVRHRPLRSVRAHKLQHPEKLQVRDNASSCVPNLSIRLSMVLVDWLWGSALCFGVTLGTSVVAVRFLDDREAPLMEYGSMM